jgi:hypothetical protein
MRSRTWTVVVVASCVALVAPGSHSRAALIPIGPEAFPAGSPLLTFDGLSTNTEVNGLVVSGVTFQVAVAGAPANGLVVIDGGPGPSNHISPPNIVSLSNPAGVTLTALLPTASTQFGYGYAVLTGGTVPAATTIQLFNGATSLGSLSYTATSDPIFPGGFAGIDSTTPFDRVVLTFAPIPVAVAFAVDNIRFTPIPEPSSVVLLSLGLGVVAYLRAHRRRAA